MRAHELTGRTFGLLTVIERTGSLRNSARWLCQCECGRTTLVTSWELVRRGRKSCGCYTAARTHGHTSGGDVSLTYRSWKSMMARCFQPSNPAFAYYKKLGVTVCDRWRDFSNFLADMGERPSEGHSIDRHPNKTGDYEPGNCRWATKAEQTNNRVTNRTHFYNGRNYSLLELSKATGLSKEMLRHRIVRAGWPIELAVSTPPSPGQRIGVRAIS